MVHFVYVDNSNVWIEGQRLSAVKKGLATSIADANASGVVDNDWRYDFGRLYELVCPSGTPVGRSILIGSKPPPSDSVWELARDQGFEVEVYQRSASGEKRVDTSIVRYMLEDSYEHMDAARGDVAVLISGDQDYVPSIESLKNRGIGTRVVFWNHATNATLRSVADQFVALDPHLESIARS